jgi:MFS family permease
MLTVLGPFAAGYFLSYMYRSINAVVAPDLVRDIGLSASELGVLTAAYLVAFGLFQLPLGLLLDRFGPRRVQTALLLTAAMGSLLFAMGTSAIALTGARAVIGLGFAGGLMSGFKAVVLWFPPARHALANACIMSFGGLGIVTATVPAELAIQIVGWRGLFLGAGAITVLVAGLIFVVVPERPDGGTPPPLGEQLRDIVTIYRDRFFWRLAPVVALTGGTAIALQTLWAGPWLRDIAGLPRDRVAVYLMMLAFAFLVGTLATGVVADRLGRRGIDLLHVMLGGIVLFLLAQGAIIAEWTAATAVIWSIFGMVGQICILAYPRLSRHFGTALSGRAQTAMNLVLFLTAFAAQALVGAVIDRFPLTEAGGYDPQGYRWAFGLLLALQILAIAWYLRRAPARDP